MEALIVIFVIGFIILIGVGLYEPAVVVCLFLWAWLRAIWPFLLGIIIGLPIWSINQPLGNIIVIVGLVGNIIWCKKYMKPWS